MTDVQSIQGIESIKVLLYITTAVLIISTAIIGYFLSKREDAIVKRDEAMTIATNNLTDAVQQLKTIVNSLQLQHEIRQPLVDAALELHRQTLDANDKSFKEFDKRLLKLETEHNLFTCKYEQIKTKNGRNESTVK